MNGMEVLEIKKETKWTSKKELMGNLQISSDTIEQIINDFSCRRPADTQNHIKKGGYHNSEVFYDDYLINIITAELAKHNTNQNTGIIQKQMSTEAKEQGNWYSLEELSQITGYGKDKLNHLLTESSFVQMSKAHSKLGGYHNSQKFYDEYILKAIKAYQLKAHGNMINAEQANQTTANILSKAEQMMDLQTIAESGIDKIYNCYDR